MSGQELTSPEHSGYSFERFCSRHGLGNLSSKAKQNPASPELLLTTMCNGHYNEASYRTVYVQVIPFYYEVRKATVFMNNTFVVFLTISALEQFA